MRQKIQRGIAVAGIALGALGMATSSASATAAAEPTGCHYEVTGSPGAAAYCEESNGGEYRAVVMCKYADGTLQHFDGPWKQTGWSYIFCEGDATEVYGAGIQTRA